MSFRCSRVRSAPEILRCPRIGWQRWRCSRIRLGARPPRCSQERRARTALIQPTIAKPLPPVVNEDLPGYSLGPLSLTPKKTLSPRLAEAADPRVPVDPQSREALLKLATAAFNTLLAITGTVLSSSEFADIA